MDRRGRRSDDSTGRDARAPAPRRTQEVLRSTFRRFLWSAYDNLGLLILANLVWLALCVPVITAPAATAGLFLLTSKIAAHEDASISDIFTGFRAHFLPALKLGAFTLTVVFLVWVNIDFYSHMGGGATIPGMLLAALMIWTVVFIALMHVHLHPLIAGGDRGLRMLLRKSALLALDNPGYTTGVAVQALAVAVICLMSGAGLFLALGSFTALLFSTGHRELLKKYFPDAPESSEPEETRVWRDLWKPWETRSRS